MGRIAVALAFIGVALYFNFEAANYPRAASRLPTLLSWVVLALAALMIVEVLVRHRATPGGTLAWPRPEWGAVLQSLAFVAAVVAYAWTIAPLGYFIATPLFLLVTLGLFRAVSWPIVLAVTIGMTLVIWAVFVWFLRLPMPLFPNL